MTRASGARDRADDILKRSVTTLQAEQIVTNHDVDNENGNVAERASSSTQVGERLVTGRVDDEQSRELVLLEVGLNVQRSGSCCQPQSRKGNRTSPRTAVLPRMASIGK